MKGASKTATESMICLRMQEIKRHRDSRNRRMPVVCWIIGIALIICFFISFLGGGENGRTTAVEHADSYGQIYQYYVGLLEKQDQYVLAKSDNLSGVMSSAGDLNTGAAQAVRSENALTQAYTSMNRREKGIGEADRTVTDGKWIYTLTADWEAKQNFLVISKPDGKNTGKVLRMPVPLPKDKNDHPYALYESPWPVNRNAEIYVKGNILVIAQELCGEFEWDIKTAAYFYDISDITCPRELRHTVQNGGYRSIREYDGMLYLVTQRTDIPVTAMEEKDKERYIPESDGGYLGTDHIILSMDAQGNSYTMISSWRLQGEIKRRDIKAVIGHYPDIYMTENNLYLSTTLFADVRKKDLSDQSRIIKFRILKGKMTEDNAVTIPGAITNCFGIQEDNDKLYVVTQRIHYTYYEENERYTDGTDICAYALDEKMRLISKKDGIAKEEDVKAVRFLGDIGYIVSYKETDPLIGIDFSTPRKLKITDELKMPGFSTYLHPVGDHLLLGLGRSENGHMKIALYDISDNYNIKILDEKIIKNIEESHAETDYRKVFLDEENGIVGLGGAFYKETDDEEEEDHESHYVLYHYERSGGLRKLGDHKIPKAGEGLTGMRIGDWFYVIPEGEDTKIFSYPYKRY